MEKTPEESRAHKLWKGIAQRAGKHKNYKTSENLFLYKEEFTDWCVEQENFMSVDETGKFWTIDKDIIQPFNKSYGPNTCCFVPQSINVIFRDSPTGKRLMGVSEALRGYTKFKASISINREVVILGYFKEEMEAHQAWQEAFIEKLNLLVTDNHYNLNEKILNGIRNYALMVQLALNHNVPTTSIIR